MPQITAAWKRVTHYITKSKIRTLAGNQKNLNFVFKQVNLVQRDCEKIYRSERPDSSVIPRLLRQLSQFCIQTKFCSERIIKRSTIAIKPGCQHSRAWIICQNISSCRISVMEKWREGAVAWRLVRGDKFKLLSLVLCRLGHPYVSDKPAY